MSMSRSAPQTILMTGASGGIGTALATRMAKPDRHLILIGRDDTKLKSLAEAVTALGATVETKAIDVRNLDALEAGLNEVFARLDIDTVIVNAGVTAGLGPNRSRESRADMERQIDINLRAAMHTGAIAAEALRQKGQGRIAFVASLAGLRALPDMPSYSATKAGLIAYGHSLRGWLRPFGISVTVICPGFVTSPMSARHKGAKPFEVSAEKAAGWMWNAIVKRKASFAFPFPLAFGIHLQNFLPQRIGDLFMPGFSAEIDPDPRYIAEQEEKK